MVTLGDKSEQNEQKENSKNFSCEKCHYICSKKFNLNRHISTCKGKKEKMVTMMVTKSEQNEQSEQTETFTCENCCKEYKHRQGLWRHKKTCSSHEIKILKHPMKLKMFLKLLQN